MANTKPPSSASTTGDLRVAVSSDKLSVFLHAEASAVSRSWESAEIITLLEQAGVPASSDLKSTVEGLQDLKLRPQKQDKFLLLKGKTPVAAQSPRFEITLPYATVVACEQVVATVTPHVPGTDGADIFGRPIEHKVAPQDLPSIGDGLKIEAMNLVATINGLFLTGEVPAVEATKVLTATDGVNEAEISVEIRGSLADGRSVKSKRSVVVTGAVEACDVFAGHDLIVGGGVASRGKGSLSVGRFLKAKFLNGATVLCRGNIEVESEISSTTVLCNGKINSPNAALMGGKITAGMGISCRTIGSPSFVRGVVEIGIDPRFQKLFAAQFPVIQANRKRSEQVRRTVEPLLSNQKHLTGPQKEKATELLYDAQTLDEDTQKRVAALRAVFDELTKFGLPTLSVSQLIFPGTLVRFPGIETTFRTAMNGPLRIVAIGTGVSRRLLVYMGESTTGSPLESRSIDEDAQCQMLKLLAA